MTEAIRCIIVEDEFPAAKLLEKYVKDTAGLKLLKIFDNPLLAIDYLEIHQTDLVLLDIQMPQMKGTEMARRIMDKANLVFTTAYPQYAVESYEFEAVDYLLKPFRYDRFLEAIDKVARIMARSEESDKSSITVKSGYDLIKIPFSDIRYIEGMREYVAFHTREGRILSYLSLKSLIEVLPPDQFMRVHRSFIVNRGHVDRLRDHTLFVGDKKLPVSRSFYKDVKKEFLKHLDP